MKLINPNSMKCTLVLLIVFSMIALGVPNTIVQDVSATVSGKEVSNCADIAANDDQMIVLASFIKNTFGMNVEAVSRQSPAASVYYSNQVAVLMYHHIDDRPEASHILSVHAFEEQMELLRKNGFHVISMEEYVSFMTKGVAVPDNAVLLTFDDGYESFYTKAYPILRKYKYAATNFVIVSSIDKRTGLSKLTWDQMREMQREGISFYSHTYDSHRYGPINAKGLEKPILTHRLYLKDKKRVETDKEYMERIKTDLETAEKRLKEELGNTRGIMAFPYGAYNKQVLGVLKSMGIELTFLVDKGMTARKNKVAYRFNAGSSKQTPEELIKLLKGANGTGGRTKKKEKV